MQKNHSFTVKMGRQKGKAGKDMKYIREFKEGDRITGVYLCKHKQAAVTKNGKPYENVILQDKTGTLDAKIWDPNSQGIDDFDAMDYIEIMGDVTSFAGALQISIKRARKAGEGEYDPGDYLPVSACDRDEMYRQLMSYVNSVKNKWLSALLKYFLWRIRIYAGFSVQLCRQKCAPRICRRTAGAYAKCGGTV